MLSSTSKSNLKIAANLRDVILRNSVIKAPYKRCCPLLLQLLPDGLICASLFGLIKLTKILNIWFHGHNRKSVVTGLSTVILVSDSTKHFIRPDTKQNFKLGSTFRFQLSLSQLLNSESN